MFLYNNYNTVNIIRQKYILFLKETNIFTFIFCVLQYILKFHMIFNELQNQSIMILYPDQRDDHLP